MTNETSSSKRTRRSKQDPQFVFDHSTREQNETIKRTPTKTSTIKNSRTTESSDNDGELYEPGDIVWCKLGNFPWWPALIFRCEAEGAIHTKLLNSNNKPKRLFFVYFYGKYLEYSWISTRWLLKYAGLSEFIQDAEAAVQKASTKSEQQELANRFQLKVSMKKRVQWDEAIELADRALSMSKAERIEQFSELLEEASESKKTRRRKISLDEIDRTENIDTTKLSNGTEKKRLKKTSESRSTRSSTKTNENIQTNNLSNGTNEVEYDYPLTTTNTNDPNVSAAFLRLIPTNIPPLSNFEQKQIVEGLLHHPKSKTLTFDEGQSYAIEKAIEIVFDNHQYRMTNIASEWFYDMILLKSPSLVYHYRHWFDHVKTDIIPNGNDLIQLRLWQIALMIDAQMKIEEQKKSVES